MKKSIFLFFAAILCAMSVSAKTIYLKPGPWNVDGAWFAVHLCNGTESASWHKLTPTQEDAAIYSVEIEDSKLTVEKNKNIIFCRMNKDKTALEWGSVWNQTADLENKLSSNNCYTITGWGGTDGSWSTYTYDPLATNVFIAGEMNGWSTTVNEFRKAAKDDNTATLTLNLAAGNYDFKIVNGGNWLGNNGDITTDISGWTFKSGDGDCTLKANIAGDYTFTWAISTSKLSITYPTICAITATANDAAMGTVTGAGNYGKGSTATLTATPNDGYLFVNWTKGGELVSNDKTYSFEVTEAVELVANFEAAAEEVHNVTVSYVCGGNKIAEDQTISAVGVTTAQPVEAPAIFGYTFASWTLGAGVTSSNTTANPISINTVASGSDFTLTANYTEIPKVTVYFVNNKKWSDVYVYGWEGTLDANPGWPGQKITANKEAEKIAGFDVYSYSVVPGSYQKIIFNKGEGGDDNQTKNYKWVDGKYYWHGKADDFEGVTKDYFSVPVVAGNSTPIFGTSWDIENANNEMQEQADGTYKLVKENVELSAGDVEYKVVIGHFTWDESYTSETKNDKGNSVLAINASGKYNVTFTYNPNNDNKVTATAELLEEVIVLPTISVKGAWDGWILHELVTADDDMTASVEVNVTTTGTHQFGFDVDGNFIANGVTIERENNTTTDLTGNSGNMSLVVDQVGNYTFTWTYETNSLEVTFPEKTDEPIVETIYYVRNSANGWNADDASKMEKDGDVYKKTVTFAQGVEFKVANDSWSSSFGYDKLNNQSYKELESGSDENIKMKEAKTFTIIFNPSENLITFEGLTPATYSNITIKAYTESAAPQIWWWNGGSKCPDAAKTYTWENAPTMTAVAGETNWYEYTFNDVNDLTGIYFKFKSGEKSSSNFEGVKEDKCYDVRDIENAKPTECGVTPSDCLECSGIYLKGEFNTWLPDNEFMKTGDANVVTLSITLEKGNYDFKVHGDEWYGNTGDMTRENTNQAWTFSKDVDDKANIRVDVSGEYIFSWKISEKQLTVTYPEFPEISNQPEKIYFLPNTNWRKDNATFAAFFLDGAKGTAAKWVAFTDPDGDGMYELTNDKQYLTMIFCRMDPNGTDSDNWKNMWNQSADITIPNTSYLNCWIDDLDWWNGVTGTWTMPLSSGDNSAAITAAAGQTVTALVNRSLVKDDGYYTLCVPFNIPASLVGKAYQISGLIQKNIDYVEVNLAESSQINAGAPYLIEPSETKDYLLVENVTIVNTPGSSVEKSISGLSVAMQGVINGAGNTDGLYWVGNGGYLYNDSASKLGLRTYFNITTPSGIAPRLRVVAGENVETSVEDIITTDAPIKVIQNGQLIIIRDGVKYNVQGQKL